MSDPSAEGYFVRPNFIPGIGLVDPFTKQRSFVGAMGNALLATALFRCWHILLFYALWSTGIGLISQQVYNLTIEPTLLTVMGTVLGFVISCRTSSSFERYNEGRKLWSQIILASRIFARTVWLHVPDIPEQDDKDKDKNKDQDQDKGQDKDKDKKMTPEEIHEAKARSTIEKVTTINLLLAFAVGVKHYLRGEDGIAYEDLYHLVRFLPPYALPAGIPDLSKPTSYEPEEELKSMHESVELPRAGLADWAKSFLPYMHTLTSRPRHQREDTLVQPTQSELKLMPASNPPRWSPLDVFPLSLFVHWRTYQGGTVKGKTAARSRAKYGRGAMPHNIPLEVTFYLSSYVSTLQSRKLIEAPTATLLLNTLNQLVDALTGLERILTTPIPFSYCVHLWAVTSIYCLVLPFQLWKPLGWIMVPATTIASFLFFGFLVAGEEIENPFGYDKNDLNLDHFTSVIINTELAALTARPPPQVSDWAFSSLNDKVIYKKPVLSQPTKLGQPSNIGQSVKTDADDTVENGSAVGEGGGTVKEEKGSQGGDRLDAPGAGTTDQPVISQQVEPNEWVRRGPESIEKALERRGEIDYDDDESKRKNTYRMFLPHTMPSRGGPS